MDERTILSPVKMKQTIVERLEYNSPDIYYSLKLDKADVKLMHLYDGELLEEFFLFIVVSFKLHDDSEGAPVKVGISMGGEFECSAEDLPQRFSVEQAEELVGSQALSMLYAKARGLAEALLPVHFMTWQLPMIDALWAWRSCEADDFFERWERVLTEGPIACFEGEDDLEPGDDEPIEDEADEEQIDRSVDRGTMGMWLMDDDGHFELQEPFKSMLADARVVATTAWTEALIGYLEENCAYSGEELLSELMRRVDEDQSAIEIFEEFVLEALGGDL